MVTFFFSVHGLLALKFKLASHALIANQLILSFFLGSVIAPAVAAAVNLVCVFTFGFAKHNIWRQIHSCSGAQWQGPAIKTVYSRLKYDADLNLALEVLGPKKTRQHEFHCLFCTYLGYCTGNKLIMSLNIADADTTLDKVGSYSRITKMLLSKLSNTNTWSSIWLS